jgi:acyl carrier protein
MVDIREDVPGDKRLVAYLVSGGERPTVSALREHLGRQLPGYMIPAAYVFLEQFPLTTSGKVDRRALPAPKSSRPELDETFAAPRTSTEETLANKIFSQVLGLDQIGVHDNFFELGGNSLQATQLVSQVKETFQVDLPLRTLFGAPKVEDLASAIEQAMLSSVSADELATVLKELEDE